MNPRVVKFLTAAARSYREGHTCIAEKLFKKTLALDPSCTQACLSLGDLAHAKGELDAAISFYHRALKFDKKCYHGWANLASCYNDKEMLLQAKKAAMLAVEINRNAAHGWQRLAELELKERKIGEAISLISLALKLDPNSHMLNYTASKIYLKGNFDEEAKKALMRTVEIKPDFSQAYFDLLELAGKSGAFVNVLNISGIALRNCRLEYCRKLLGLTGAILFFGSIGYSRAKAVARFYKELGPVIFFRKIEYPANFTFDMTLQYVEETDFRGLETAMSGFIDTISPGQRDSVDCFRAYFCLGKYKMAFEVVEKLLLKKEMDRLELCNPWPNNRQAPKINKF
jgi:lipopolysaccharide biosynthesis regulator YciM